jgi:hypothetical protein
MVLQWVSTQEELPNDMEDILIFNEEDGAEHIGYFLQLRDSLSVTWMVKI